MADKDENYRQLVQETIREISTRRITVNDLFIFNYRSSMTKVDSDSELIMPMGASGEAPIQVSSIDVAESPN